VTTIYTSHYQQLFRSFGMLVRGRRRRGGLFLLCLRERLGGTAGGRHGACSDRGADQKFAASLIMLAHAVSPPCLRSTGIPADAPAVGADHTPFQSGPEERSVFPGRSTDTKNQSVHSVTW